MSLTLHEVPIVKPEAVNVVLGQTHFIKTVEDLHEALVCALPGIKFGLAFCEASGPCLLRTSGTDPEMETLARDNLRKIACGHSFLVTLRDCFPINVLRAIRECPEVCSVFCATANPCTVVVAENALGRGIMGVIDGTPPKGIETPADVAARKAFLRKIGYKG